MYFYSVLNYMLFLKLDGNKKFFQTIFVLLKHRQHRSNFRTARSQKKVYLGSIFMLPSWLQIEPKVVYRHRLSSHLSSTFKLLASRFRFADFFSLEFSLSSSNLFLRTDTSL